jgi:threonine/homoserine/homoserine lactone efflux protein
MEKMQTIIALLIFVSAPVITMAVFAQIVLRATISDNEEFKKYFMQTIALVLLWIGILLVLCILNYPLIIKFLNS